jgi:hypothetical protein
MGVGIPIWLFLAVFCVANLASAATYKTVNDEVVIEAEKYTRLGGTKGGKWFVNTAKPGFSGSGYLESSTADPKSTTFIADISRVEYDIDFKTTGTYYIHLRSWALDHTENGFFALIDGKHVDYHHDHADYVYVKKRDRWWWYTDAGGAEQRGIKLSFNISTPGKKVFSILRRDKGSRMDVIYLTKKISNPQDTDSLNHPAPSIFIADGSGGGSTVTAEICNDGIDNDLDGLIDCDDFDCDGNTNCIVTPPSTETNCGNNFDDDGDGWTDCADPDCAGATNCTPDSEGNCSDGIDNDGDGTTDCADPDCSNSAACTSASYAESFDSSQGSFSYRDDVFRGTNQPAYARGSYTANGGYSGGGLYVALGGVDSSDVEDGISGGWSDEFRVQQSGTTNISMRYRLVTNRYDADECGEFIVAVDDVPLLVNGNDYVQRFCGEDDSGWRQASFDVDLTVGLHKLTVGGFNNKKSAALEITEIYIDDIVITESETSSGGTEPPAVVDGFAYSDDTFRDTNNPMYASGSTEGDALKVSLGGIDRRDVTNGMSGGWRTTINTSTNGEVQINLMYRLITSNYDSDECGQALVAIDGNLLGLGAADYLDRICGEGDSDWQEVSLNVYLTAGSHTLTLGGYNNKKTALMEITEILFKQIEIIE